MLSVSPLKSLVTCGKVSSSTEMLFVFYAKYVTIRKPTKPPSLYNCSSARMWLVSFQCLRALERDMWFVPFQCMRALEWDMWLETDECSEGMWFDINRSHKNISHSSTCYTRVCCGYIYMKDTSIHHENPEIANVVNTSLVPGHSSIRCLHHLMLMLHENWEN